MTLLPHVAARLFGAPLLIHRPKLDVILSVLGPRVGVTDMAAPGAFAPPQRPSASTASANDKIAVIPIHGTLVRRTVGLEAESGLASYAAIASQLDAALANPNAAAILLDIDSPGGESGGVFDLADRIRSAAGQKPVWAVANDMAFSAAYALASGASRMFVSRTGGVGSIGVIAMHIDQSAKDAQDGVRYTAVFAGDRKNDLNPHQPITGEAQAFLQAEVDRVYGLFVETVARHRGLRADAVVATQAGLYFAQDAVSAGLADAVGSFDEALARLHASISSRPILLASGSGTSLTLQKDHPMNAHAEAGAPAPLVADAAPGQFQPTPAHASSTTTAAAETFSVADAVEIAQTCALAGRSDLVAGFLEAKMPPAKVRSHLLAAQADSSPEIVSRIDPNAPAKSSLAAANPASPNNPLIQAVKSRLGASNT
ncbi:S49 family peptidase [Ramlibacter sp. AW1]|uniref:S49 family peptidase n=1 Tax=Ramlibacter aurantiacus TaxID=2801330 RepID=A0A937D823_9BURK|nr:S49 family peptidase [Ramlibacter aurantiacus]MBL0422588.1 S49 family peptidase [Ramlibacter aurantiacus]